MNNELIPSQAPRNNRAKIKRRFNIDFPEICPFCHSDHFHIGIGYWYHLDESTMTNHSMIMANFECLDCHRVFGAMPALSNDYNGATLMLAEKVCLMHLYNKWKEKDEKPIFSNEDF